MIVNICKVQYAWTTSIYLRSIFIPSHHLTWRCWCRTTFSAKLCGMHSESWVTNCARNLLGTPPSFQRFPIRVPKTKPARTARWKSSLLHGASRKEGVLLQPGTLAHTYPSSLELETGGQSPANYPYCRRRFTSQRVWVPGEPCASFLAQKYTGSSGKFRCATTR